MGSLRSPDRSSRTARAALLGGVCYVLVVLATPPVMGFGVRGGLASLLGALFDPQVGPLLWWGLLGGAIVGAVVAVAAVRYRLVTPALSVAVAYAVSVYQMWRALQTPAPLLPGTPYDIYVVGWPVLLLLAVGVGAIELRVRTARRASTDPT